MRGVRGALAMHAASRFGLSLEGPEAREPPRIEGTEALRALVGLAPGAVALVTGPSGAGKSTLLRAAGAALGARVLRMDEADALPEIAAVEVAARAMGARGDDEARAEAGMRLLSRVGLGEARCFVRTPSMLSTGQRQRLRLAAALARSRRGGALLVDEFLHGLDPATARTVAALLARECRRDGVRLAVATGNGSLGDSGALGADAVVRVSLAGAATVERRGVGSALARRWRVVRGSYDDYRALRSFHYRASAPAAPVLTLRAEDGDGSLAGVLVVVMPTLRGVWREAFWPGRYDAVAAGRREVSRRLNAEVRRIGRLVVDPRFRGAGVARALVRAYLDEPLTVRTEAVSGMGVISAFHEAAGMRSVMLPVSAWDQRLLDAMAHGGLSRHEMAAPRGCLARWVGRCGEGFVEREVRRWARASGATRRWAGEPLERLFARACAAAACRKRAFGFEKA